MLKQPLNPLTVTPTHLKVLLQGLGSRDHTLTQDLYYNQRNQYDLDCWGIGGLGGLGVRPQTLNTSNFRALSSTETYVDIYTLPIFTAPHVLRIEDNRKEARHP